MAEHRFQTLFQSYRRQVVLTYEALGQKLNISKSNISKYANGGLPYPKDLFERTCELFRLSPVQREEFRAAYEDYREQIEQRLQRPPEPMQSAAPALTDTGIWSSSIPMQLPPRARHFVGRESLIAEIGEQVRPARTVTLIGPGGIGKTAIAAEVVHGLLSTGEMLERFPDGLLYHSFYGVAETSAAVALTHFVLSFGEQPLPTPGTAARRVLAKRQLLVLLDGAENADNLDAIVEVLSPSAGVLMTSRRKTDAPDLPVLIRELPPEDSKSVLQAWSKGIITDQSIAGQICHLVGYLPLALCIAGSYLCQRALTPQEYLDILKKSPFAAMTLRRRQRRSVPFLIEKSLAQVSEDARLAMAVVGLLGGTYFDREALMAAIPSPRDEVIAALGELVDYCLIERVQGRFRVMHTLLHTYARENMYVSEESVSSLATHYASKLESYGDEDLGEAIGRGSPANRLKLAEENANIQALIRSCFRYHQPEHALRLIEPITTFLLDEGYWGERIAFLEQACKEVRLLLAQQLDQPSRERLLRSLVGLLLRLGWGKLIKGELGAAETLYNEANEIAEQFRMYPRWIQGLRDLGYLYALYGETARQLGQDVESAAYFDRADGLIGKAISTAANTGDHLGFRMARAFAARVDYLRGDPDHLQQAKNTLLALLTEYQSLGEPRNVLATQRYLALISLQQGDLALAERFLIQAEGTLVIYPEVVEKIRLIEVSARLEEARGAVDLARAKYEDALKRTGEMGMKREELRISQKLSELGARASPRASSTGGTCAM